MRSARVKPPRRVDHQPIEWLSEYRDEDGRTSPDLEVDGMAADSFPASDPPSFTLARLGRPSAEGPPLDYVGGKPPPRRQSRRSPSRRRRRA